MDGGRAIASIECSLSPNARRSSCSMGRHAKFRGGKKRAPPQGGARKVKTVGLFDGSGIGRRYTFAPCSDEEIGRAHVGTPVTNAHLVCRLLLEKKKRHNTKQLIKI